MSARRDVPRAADRTEGDPPLLVLIGGAPGVGKSAVAVLQSFMQESFDYVLFSWVLHLDSVADAILSAVLPPGAESRCFSLVCDDQTLLDRLASDPDRSTDPALALDRLRATRSQVRMETIDSEGRAPSEVAETLFRRLGAAPRSR